MHEVQLESKDLELLHIDIPGLLALYEDKSDLQAIAGRNITNPWGVLLDPESPLHWRVPQVKADPTSNKWFFRWIVLKENREAIGSLCFHGVPNEAGMIEIGLGLVERYRNRGYARQALRAIWLWAIESPEVRVLRYTVSPDNLPSVKVIEYFGFSLVGQQIDEEDGPEDIYEMTSEDFRKRWGSHV